MSQFNKINDTFSVAPQLPPHALDAAAKEGFVAVICNRPDHEEPGQPTLEDQAKTATRAGLAFHAVPFDMSSLDRGVIDAFELALKSADGPVLAYCRSGTRSTIAWCAVQLRAGRELESVLNDARSAGYELSAQAPLIQALA
ncbi:MAG: TIGR01244 family sulfur transferase [Granulosicoccaceae bacterium]